jgi:flagellar basal body-associated protein FliL
LETGPTVVYHPSMPEASLGEIYFIVFMMVLVLIISTVSLYIFVKTYKKEMRERGEEKSGKQHDEVAESSSEEKDK